MFVIKHVLPPLNKKEKVSRQLTKPSQKMNAKCY